MSDLIKPQEIQIETENGKKTFILSRFPYKIGREIIAAYPMTALPKIGDYKLNEEACEKLLTYVAVPTPNGEYQRLTTEVLKNNHIDSWETCIKLEWEMIQYNCSFFRDGRASTFLSDIVQTLPQWISKISTALAGASLQKE